LAQFKIGPDSEFTLHGQRYCVIGQDGSTIYAQRMGDKKHVRFYFAALVSDSSFEPGEGMMVQPEGAHKGRSSRVSRLSESEREDLSQRHQFITPILFWRDAKAGDKSAERKFLNTYKRFLYDGEEIRDLTQEKLIRRIVEQWGGSRATIMRLLAKYTKNHDLEDLIPEKGKGSTGRKDSRSLRIIDKRYPDIIQDVVSTRLDEKYVEILEYVIKEYFLTTQSLKKSDIYEISKNHCRAKKIEKLPYVTISKILDFINPEVVARARHPSKAKQDYKEVARGYSETMALKPLDVVQIDHTQLDIDVCDDTRIYTIGRPWLTLGIDVYSRYPWCMYLSFDKPSAQVVRRALEHGVFFKNAQEKFQTEKEWDAFGIPETIYVDNGMEFHSTEVERLVNEVMKSELMYRPVKEPYYGAVIERLIGTINRSVLARMPGSRKSSVAELGDYDPDSNASLTLDELRKILVIYFVDVCANHEHPALPPDCLTPRLMFYQGIQMYGNPRFMDEHSREYYKFEFLPTNHRKYNVDGVRLGKVLYRISNRSDLIGPDKPKYEIKYDPDDVSAIYLKDPHHAGEWIELPAHKPRYEKLAGMNGYLFRKVQLKMKELGRERNRSILGDQDIEIGQQRIYDEWRSGYTKKRQVRQELNRANGNVQIAYPTEQAMTKASPSSEDEERLIEKIKATQKRRERMEQSES